MPLSFEQQGLRDGALYIARAFAEPNGGTSWTVRRPSGDGITTPRTLTTNGTARTLYVNRESLTKLEQALAGAQVPDAKWRAYGAANVDLLPDDEITSTTDSTFVFIVASVDTDEGYLQANLERKS